MAVDPKLIWLVGTCKKGGKPDTREMCEAGYVPVLFSTLEDAMDEMDARMRVETVIILPSCAGDADAFTSALREVWPKVNVCVASCRDNCRTPGALACAMSVVN